MSRVAMSPAADRLARALPGLTIRPLAEAPETLPALAALMKAEWPGWYGPGGPGEALADLRARSRLDGLPQGVVALEDGHPIGCAALAAASYGALAGETPWVVGLLVAPGRRGRGIGSALVEACEERARALGVLAVLATTASARGLLQRRGWALVRELKDGQAVHRRALA